MLPKRFLRLVDEMQILKYQIETETLKSVQILQFQEFKYAIFLCSGPIDSPYQGFWFRIKVQWPEDYPYRPPKCTLLDKVWNPFVDYDTNQICIDILSQKGYSPALTTIAVIQSIFSLLGESKISEINDGFANPQAAIQMMKNYPYFCEHSRKLCEISSYKSQQIYSNQMRGLPDEHIIEVESHQLPILIAESLESKKFNKKPQKEQKMGYEENQNQKVILEGQNQANNEQNQLEQLMLQQVLIENPIIQSQSVDKEQQFKQLVEKHRNIVKNRMKYRSIGSKVKKTKH